MKNLCPIPENIHLVDLAFSYRTLNSLARVHVRTAADLITYSPDHLLSLRGFGQTSLAECFKALAPYGLTLRIDPPFPLARRGRPCLPPVQKNHMAPPKSTLVLPGDKPLTMTEVKRAERRAFYERRLQEGAGISLMAAELGLSRQMVSMQVHTMGLDFPPRQCVVCGSWFKPKQGRTTKCHTGCRVKFTTEERSAMMKVLWSDTEFISRQRESAKSPIRRAKLRLHALERWNSPEFKAKMREKIWTDVGRREAQSRRMKALHISGVFDYTKTQVKSKKNAAHCAKMKERWADPEYRRKQSAARKAKWSDPIYRAKQEQTQKAKRVTKQRKRYDNPAQMVLALF